KKGGFMATVVAFPENEAELYGVRVARSFTRPSAQILTAIKDLVEAGKVMPHIETVMALADIKQALALSENERARGKIVLNIAD
ncbi:MAG: zinc-binding dehydrogenase, partial [Cypionkella sp.]